MPKTRSRSRDDRSGQPSQIIGFRLPQSLARDVKAEAARRGISLKRLFEELWDDYSKRPKK